MTTNSIRKLKKDEMTKKINKLIILILINFFANCSDDENKKSKKLSQSEKLVSSLIGNINGLQKMVTDYTADYVLDIVFKENFDLIESIAFSPDSKNIASAGSHIIQIWDIVSGNVIHKHNLIEYSDEFVTILYSNNGKLLAAGSSPQGDGPLTNNIKIFDTVSNKLINTILFYHSDLSAITFSTDDKYIASAFLDGSIKVNEINTGDLIYSFLSNQINEPIRALKYSIDNKTLISASNTEINILDAKTGDILKTVLGYFPIAYSGKYLASDFLNNTVRIWDANNYNLIDKLYGHNDSISSIIFSANSKYLFASFKDKTIKIWDINNRKLMHIERQLSLPVGDNYLCRF